MRATFPAGWASAAIGAGYTVIGAEVLFGGRVAG